MKTNKNKDIILKEINKLKDPCCLKDLCGKTKLSYPTILRWVEVLKAEKKIEIKNYSNKIRLVSPN